MMTESSAARDAQLFYLKISSAAWAQELDMRGGEAAASFPPPYPPTHTDCYAEMLRKFVG